MTSRIEWVGLGVVVDVVDELVCGVFGGLRYGGWVGLRVLRSGGYSG